jgi:hypothetical protein
MEHRFQVHQLVRAKGNAADGRGNNIYEIVRLLPPAPDGTPLYRIKGATERTERVVEEHQIEAAAR